MTVSEVAVAAVTVAAAPLNVTVLVAGVGLKLVPVMVIFDPTGPIPGLILVTVGAGRNLKTAVEVADPPAVVTETVPVLAPGGTVTVSAVAVAAMTAARVPLKATAFSAAVVLNLVPVIVTFAPIGPVFGLKPVTVGGTLNATDDMATPPAVFTETWPVVAPGGTMTVSEVAVAAVTVAAAPLNVTVLVAGVVLKLVPVMMTFVPAAPVSGLIPVTIGAGRNLNTPPEVAVPPAVVTETVPVLAPGGTVTVSAVAVAAMTLAMAPLNLTALSTALVLNLVPEIVTFAPTGPVFGLKPVTVGGTLNATNDVVIPPAVFTATLPVVAPCGTVTVSEVAVAAVTVAAAPLNVTVLFAGVVLKLVPVMMTFVPAAPTSGLIPVTIGAGRNADSQSKCNKSSEREGS